MFTYDGEVSFCEAVATTLNNIHSCNLNVFLVHCLIKNTIISQEVCKYSIEGMYGMWS